MVGLSVMYHIGFMYVLIEATRGYEACAGVSSSDNSFTHIAHFPRGPLYCVILVVHVVSKGGGSKTWEEKRIIRTFNTLWIDSRD